MCGTNIVSGAGTFTLASGSGVTLGLGDPNGITTVATNTGNIQTTTARNYNSGQNFMYNCSNAVEATGNGLPNSIYNLSITNTASGGVVALSNATTVTNVLTLNQGVLNLGSNNLNLTNTSLTAIQGNTTSATNMIEADGSGYLNKSIPSGPSASFTYPIGDNNGSAHYSPVTMSFISNNNAGTVGARA